MGVVWSAPTQTGRAWRRAGGLACVVASCVAPLQGQTCSPSAPAAAVDSLRRSLDRAAAVAPVWDSYAVRHHPVVLMAALSDAPAGQLMSCVAVWRHKRPLRWELVAGTIPLSTPLYGMVNLDPVGARAAAEFVGMSAAMRNIPPAVATWLASRGVTRAVVLPVPLRFESLGAFGDALRAQRTDPVMLQVYLAVHESFHLHSQFPTWFDQSRRYAWPVWDRQPDRARLAERCYRLDDAVRRTVEDELAALRDAFDALWPSEARAPATTPANRARAMAALSRFAAHRTERYRLVDTVRIPSGATTVSCRVAEDVMELEEGAPQWIAHATAVRAGLSSLSTYRASYAAPQAQAFYQFGALQLWVLQGIRGADFVRRLGRGIAATRSIDEPGATIFSAVRAAVPPDAKSAADEISGYTRDSVYFRAVGPERGDAVVLVHAFSVDSRMWRNEVALLSRTHRVVVLDARGHGRSRRVDGAYSSADDVVAVMDQLRVDRATIVGLSSGVTTAVDAALAFPARVRALVLVAGGVSGMPTPQLPWFAPIGEAVQAGDTRKASALWARTPLMMLRPSSDEQVRLDSLIDANHAIWSMRPLEELHERNARTRLGEIAVPTLVMYGTGDLPHIHDAARAVAAGIPGARLRSIADARHMLNLDAPAAFGALLLEFLRSPRTSR